MTRISISGFSFAYLSAKSEVPSVEPSSMIKISVFRLGMDKMCLIVDLSILGIRLVSLYVGTMIERSTVAGSLMYGRGIGLLGDVRHRYFFSEE